MRNFGMARQAAVAAALMMAWQVAAKTARDSLFLSTFHPHALPAMVGAASVCSIVLSIFAARLLRRFGPFRVIPAGYLLSAAMHGGEWLLLPMFPRAIPVIVYLHVLSLGAVLLSGFWAVANEQFDPREARRRFGRITGFGTLGGLAGGAMAERVATIFSNHALLVLLLGLQVACWIVLLEFSKPRVRYRRPAESPRLAEILSKAPYLVGLSGLMVLVAMTAAMLDYLFKFEAVAQFGRGPGLSRFFALFYMAAAGLGFLAQAGASRYWLNRFGLGRTVATLPVGVAGAGLLAALSPGAVFLTLARGLEQVLRSSLFRSGYELFYTPMPRAEKRSAKSVIDIGADRAGDGLGAAAVQLLIALPAAPAVYSILFLTVALACCAAWLSFRLDRAYSAVLEKNLAQNAVDLTPAEVEDFTTRSTILRAVPARIAAGAPQATSGLHLPGRPPGSAPAAVDLPLQQLAELRCDDPARVKAALRGLGILEPIHVPQVMRLLAWEEVWRSAHTTLARNTFRIAGQLADCLLDENQDYVVRMRIPRLLAACDTRLAWNGLFEALADRRFEIRFRSARALDTMLQRRPEFQPTRDVIYPIVEKELSVSQTVWRARRSPRIAEDEADFMIVDQVLKERMSRSLAHVFSLLSLVLPRDAVQTAFRALHTEDARLRALALEYLESVLPRELREPLCGHLEGLPHSHGNHAEETSLNQLLEESPSIVARLEDLGFRRPQ